MRLITKTSFIAFLFCSTIFAQKQEDIRALISHDFERITRIENDKTTSLLTQILYNKGQKKNDDSLRIQQIEKKNLSEKQQILYNLSKGFYNLYNQTDSWSSFEFFDKAYINSKKRKYTSLHKLSLLGFLELYSKEIVQSNNLFETYLEEFKKLSKTKEEKAWVLYYTNFFLSTSIFKPSDYYNMSRKLIPFLENNELSISIQAKFYEDIGLFYNRINKVDSAYLFYNRLMDLPDLPYIKTQKFNSCLDLAELSVKENNRNQASAYLKTAERYYNKSDSIRSYFNLDRFKAIHFYEKVEEFDSAYFALKNSISKEHQLDYRSNSLEISKLNIKLRTVEKEKEILRQEAQISEEKRKRNQFLYGAIGFFSFGGIIVYLVYNNMRRKQQIKEQEVEIEKQRVEKVLREQELMLIDAMIEGQEKERKEVAEELHDNVATTLSAANLQLNYFIDNNEKVINSEEILKKAAGLLTTAYKDVHAMAHSKNKGVVAEKGLLNAVKDLTKNISITNKIFIEVKSSELTGRIRNSLEIKMFRTIQELVNNIVKHSKANEASISITQHDNILNIMIEDNGIGIDLKGSNRKGIGLRNIEKRIELLDGTMEIDSHPNRGTTIVLEIPI